MPASFFIIPLLYSLIWPLALVGIGYAIFSRRKKGASHQPSSPLVFYSEILLFLAVLFAWYCLYALNRSFGLALDSKTILLIVSTLTLALSYYHRTLLTLALGLLCMLVWWNLWVFDTGMIGNATSPRFMSLFVGEIFVFLNFFSLGSLHQGKPGFRRFHILYSIFGLVPLLGALFFFSSQSGLSLLGEMTKSGTYFASFKLSSSVIAWGLLALATLLLAYFKRALTFMETIGAISVGLAFAVMAMGGSQVLTTGYGYTASVSPLGVVWLLIFNVLTFGISLGYIFLGLQTNKEWPINLGVALLSLYIVIKYFDWFFRFLDKSVFFIGAGLLLLGLGFFLEKGRKNILSHIQP